MTNNDADHDPQSIPDDLLERFLEGESEHEDEARITTSSQAQRQKLTNLLIADDLLRQHHGDKKAFVDALKERLDELEGIKRRHTDQTGSDAAFHMQLTGKLNEHDANTSKRQPAKSILSWLPWSLAMAASIALVISLTDAFTSKDIRSPSAASSAQKHQTDIELAALLVNSYDAVFASHHQPQGIQFKRGAYELKQGTIHLRMVNGTDLIAAAPLKIDIQDDMHMKLIHGQLRAVVPENAQGFTIAGPSADFEDLGTEFAIKVDQDTQESELHVFSGQVDVKRQSGKDDKLKSVLIGESVKVAGEIVAPMKPISPGSVPTTDTIDFLRWQAYSKKLRQDKDLIFYYDFQRTSSPQQLVDVKKGASSPIHGEIRHARWATGRWPEKDALFFDRDQDHVALTIPGEWHALTMAVWLRLDRVDFSSNAILNSNKWDKGDLHWQFSRHRQFRFSFNKVPGPIASKTPATFGRWTHLAITYDKAAQKTSAYINGRLDNQRTFKANNNGIKPGDCQIGNWDRLITWPDAPKRGFRGCMDEMAAWQRALTQDEIKAMVEAGRPTMLWSSQMQQSY